MEEVNDNMRHLWNKTYQGTGAVFFACPLCFLICRPDIDGIKIRYDSEGGATKRSYNYRVSLVYISISFHQN
jgi:DNA repair protein RAD50